MRKLRWLASLALTICAGEALALCMPGEVGVCYVNGVRGTRTCGADAIFGPCQVPSPDLYARAKPKYKVLTVIYAPPGAAVGGSASSVGYASGSSWGSTTSSARSFKQAYSVTASAKVGALGASGEVAASFGYARNTANTQAVDIKKSSTTTISHRGPGINGIDHDRDQIWLWLNPEIEVTMKPTSTEWTFVGGQTMDLQYVYVGHLKNPALMPPGVAARLAAYGITTADYADILKANPFALGATAIDTNRFKPMLTTFPYEPPYAPGDPIPTLNFNATYAYTSSTSSATSNEYNVGLKITAGGDSTPLGAKLVSDNKWTWTDTDTRGTSNGTNESAQVSIGGPSYGYTGPTDVAVYYDVLYKTFMFTTVDGPLLAPVHGTLTSRTNEPVGGREVVLTAADGTQYRTFTNARGEYRFYDNIAGAFTVRSEMTERRSAASFAAAGSRVDIDVP